MTFDFPHRLTALALISLASCGSGEADDAMGATGTPGPGDTSMTAPSVVPSDTPAAGGTAQQMPGPPGPESPAGPPSPAEMPQPEMPTEPETPTEPEGPSALGAGVMGGSGASSDRYAKSNVTRDGANYFFMANGWGPGFESQSVSWNGTSFTVESMNGQVGPNYEPATYPTVFCGRYSSETSLECGLPAPLASITSLRTGWRWAPNGNDGEYNAAYDIWMGKDDGSFGGFVMVWLREPAGQQPAGNPVEEDVTVQNVPGTWDIWAGVVYDSVPIVNWVRKTGEDSTELEFDVMDFVRDAELRGYELPGTQVNAVAVGFEIWRGPITNLQSLDFYIDVQ